MSSSRAVHGAWHDGWTMLLAICQAVVRPRAFCQNPAGRLLADRYGWLLIAARWLYYSAVFTLFRDYHGAWAPFVAAPFGLDLDTYATLQQSLSVVFGFGLMGAIAGALVAYLRGSGKAVSVFQVFNILGVTFFLPFVILQIFDAVVLVTSGWAMALIIPLHTAALLWEAGATVQILGHLHGLRMPDKAVGAALTTGIWIAIAAPLWR